MHENCIKAYLIAIDKYSVHAEIILIFQVVYSVT